MRIRASRADLFVGLQRFKSSQDKDSSGSISRASQRVADSMCCDLNLNTVVGLPSCLEATLEAVTGVDLGEPRRPKYHHPNRREFPLDSTPHGVP